MKTSVLPAPSHTATSSSESQHQGGTWSMVAAMLLSGTIGLVVVESGLPVEAVVLLRCLLGSLGLAAWLSWRRAWVRPLRSDSAWMLLGGVCLVANWVALFHAYAFVGIAVATVVYHVQPFLLVLAAALGGEPLRWRQLPWMLLALGGVVLTSGLGSSAAAALATAPHAASQAAWGVALALLAASLYTVTVLATRRVQRLPAAQVAMGQMLAGGAALALWQLPAGLALWAQSGWLVLAQPGKTWACVLLLGLVHTSLMYGLMYAAFQRLGAAAIAMLSFVYPAVALLVDLYWFGTEPAGAQWLGMALIVLAVLGYRWQELRQRV
ncbi:DMT family transporter [Comamonas sp. J-3]|uniref:DMT family transporter n=1 Tax=Comamonas trifloxystrobinivorans TaxID=3350256 RepID=UPI00372BB177